MQRLLGKLKSKAKHTSRLFELKTFNFTWERVKVRPHSFSLDLSRDLKLCLPSQPRSNTRIITVRMRMMMMMRHTLMCRRYSRKEPETSTAKINTRIPLVGRHVLWSLNKHMVSKWSVCVRINSSNYFHSSWAVIGFRKIFLDLYIWIINDSGNGRAF